MIRRLLSIVLMVLLLSGCNNTPVAQDLGQKEANEIVALLNNHGINAIAQRGNGNQGKFSVEVARGNYAQAVTLMEENDLPRQLESPFNDLTAPQGLIPNSREVEALRLDRAVGVELEAAIANIPNVSSARVIVRQHSLPAGSDPSIAAVVQTRADDEANASIKEMVTGLVENALPGIKSDHIRVAIQTAVTRIPHYDGQGVSNDQGHALHLPLVSFLLFWEVPQRDYQSLVLVMLLCILVVLTAGGLIGYWYGYFKRSRQYFESEVPELPQITSRTSARIERRPREGAVK